MTIRVIEYMYLLSHRQGAGLVYHVRCEGIFMITNYASWANTTSDK